MTEPVTNSAYIFWELPLLIYRHEYQNMLSQTEVKEQCYSLTCLMCLTKLHCWCEWPIFTQSAQVLMKTAAIHKLMTVVIPYIQQDCNQRRRPQSYNKGDRRFGVWKPVWCVLFDCHHAGCVEFPGVMIFSSDWQSIWVDVAPLPPPHDE